MQSIDWVAAAVLALPTYFLWAIVHELAHVAGAALVGDLEDWEIKPWPHVDPEMGFVWAAVGYQFVRYPSPRGWAVIALAPRVPDLVAATLLPLTCVVPQCFALPWAAYCAGGVVDLVVGSLGISPASDLRESALMLDVSPWWFRVPGLLVAAISVAVTISLL